MPQNKVLARERLLLKLRRQNDDATADTQAQQWRRHSKLERGNPVKTFIGPLAVNTQDYPNKCIISVKRTILCYF